ncbi:malate dehydrogenase, cytoplasmic-like [Diaphorina citri]|uniref:Malate dehydrogenase, cytoplasmic n=1 Tax=Diaphorina citri TaxID=121845 RepID=A0A3Q0ITA9_DIACI|nr:malate dehydrogenase, cytoplasmic-like [Diaphorina citri]
MVGAMPRKEGMERKDLLSANIKIFKVQGDALDKFAKKTVKVLVVLSQFVLCPNFMFPQRCCYV